MDYYIYVVANLIDDSINYVGKEESKAIEVYNSKIDELNNEDQKGVVVIVRHTLH